MEWLWAIGLGAAGFGAWRGWQAWQRARTPPTLKFEIEVRTTFDHEPADAAGAAREARDEWEGSFWEVPVPRRIAATLRLDYRDAAGAETLRDVDLRQYGAWEGGALRTLFGPRPVSSHSRWTLAQQAMRMDVARFGKFSPSNHFRAAFCDTSNSFPRLTCRARPFGGTCMSSQIWFSLSANAVRSLSSVIQPEVTPSTENCSCCTVLTFGCIIVVTMSPHPLSEAIRLLGINPLARTLGVTYQAVRKWEKAGRLPRTEYTGETDYAARIEQATQGAVTRAQLLARPWPARAAHEAQEAA